MHNGRSERLSQITTVEWEKALGYAECGFCLIYNSIPCCYRTMWTCCFILIAPLAVAAYIIDPNAVLPKSTQNEGLYVFTLHNLDFIIGRSSERTERVSNKRQFSCEVISWLIKISFLSLTHQIMLM